MSSELAAEATAMILQSGLGPGKSFGVPSGNDCCIAIENDHLEWIFPLEILIFHSYVELPECNTISKYWEHTEKLGQKKGPKLF